MSIRHDPEDNYPHLGSDDAYCGCHFEIMFLPKIRHDPRELSNVLVEHYIVEKYHTIGIPQDLQPTR